MDMLVEKYELTKMQNALWASQRMFPDVPLYNMIFVFDIYDKIDQDVFTKAFNAVLEKCDALRIKIHEVEGVAQLLFSPFEPYELTYIDYSYYDDPELSAKNWVELHKSQKFNLGETGFESSLLKIKDNHYQWYFNTHHLINDAWGVSVIFHQVSLAYSKFLVLESFDDLTIAPFEQIIKKSGELRNQKQKRSTKDDRQFQSRLSIFGHHHHVIQSTQNRRIKLDVDSGLYDLIDKATKRFEYQCISPILTRYTCLATVIFIWLSKITEENSLQIETPLLNRNSIEEKNAAGCSISMSPFRVDINPEDSFLDVFNKVKNETIELLRTTGSESHSRSQQSNIVFNYINAHFGLFNKMETKTTWVHPDHVDQIHDLRIQVVSFEQQDRFDIYLDVNLHLYEQLVFRFAGHQLLNIAESLSVDPATKVSQTEIICAEEKSLLSRLDVQDVQHDQHHFIDLFHQVCFSQPNNIAIRSKDQEYSYADFQSAIIEYAQELNRMGVKSGDIVAIHLKRSPELLVAMLALWQIGACYVPIPINTPTKRKSLLLTESKADFVITRNRLKNANLPSIDHPEMMSGQKMGSKSMGYRYSKTDPAYIMYTSGTTGIPKGVMISHAALSNYIEHAIKVYGMNTETTSAFYSSIGFDLTITSIFPPLLAGGQIEVFEESFERDLSILDVAQSSTINFLKATPSHLELLLTKDIQNSRIDTIVIGGEQLNFNLTFQLKCGLLKLNSVFNEYGPTEATVGCIVHEITDFSKATGAVPIGQPIQNVEILLLDEHLNQVPIGITGEIFISGIALADSYYRNAPKTESHFIWIEKYGKSFYRTGDLARYDQLGTIMYLGRHDRQVKIGGKRIELDEIQSFINSLSGIHTAFVRPITFDPNQDIANVYCVKCGLPDNYPNVSFTNDGICELCVQFETYQEPAKNYFGELTELKSILSNHHLASKGEYDCLALLSGGKDSTYMVARIADMGFRVLAFTLDNGYISEEAKENIKKVTKQLDVDHVFGSTPVMNEIFVDSLLRHCNVCNGCFKTIYTLSIKLALDKQIPFIVTGLSRGQFFETRLTEELFVGGRAAEEIDDLVLEARKSYHQIDDAVKRLMDVQFLENPEVFDKVKFVDFYRYCDVSLEELYHFLARKVPWIRPSDTGRSTNCLINQVGIYVHKKRKGFSNYAYPYSWDVRIGHKNREESLDEINEYIHENQVHEIMDEIGFEDQNLMRIEAFYTGEKIDQQVLIEQLSEQIPSEFIPVRFVHLEELPLNENGKVNEEMLPGGGFVHAPVETFEEPVDDLELLLYDVWKDILGVDRFSVKDSFITLGGTSLHAIRIAAAIEKEIEIEVQLQNVFNYPSVRLMSKHLEEILKALLEKSDS